MAAGRALVVLVGIPASMVIVGKLAIWFFVFAGSSLPG
jgi:hypothetical protein